MQEKQEHWEPKALLKALKEHDEVSLSHIAVRRDKGYLKPDVKAGRGARSKYNAFGALLYFVATKFEKAGFPMEDAYTYARSILSNDFHDCIAGDDYMWLVEVNSHIVFQGKKSSSELPFAFMKQTKDGTLASNPPEAKRAIESKFGNKDELPPLLNIDDFVKLIPADGVNMFVPKEYYKTLPEIESIQYHNVSKIVFEAVKKLKIDEQEIEKLERNSLERFWERAGMK